jgi:hypothetical protein
MTAICSLCSKAIEPSSGGKLPPWCRGCGADLKSCPPHVAAPDAAAEPSARDEEEWKERFSFHNLVVGILLFVWGLVVSAGPPQSGGEKVLRAQEKFNDLIDAVQKVTLVSGAALVASGVALRRGWRWGFPLALVCGIVQVVAGFIFLAAYQNFNAGPFIEHGVAKVLFVRTNLDMLIGLVDGLGLIWFVSTRRPRSRTESHS